MKKNQAYFILIALGLLILWLHFRTKVTSKITYLTPGPTAEFPGEGLPLPPDFVNYGPNPPSNTDYGTYEGPLG